MTPDEHAARAEALLGEATSDDHHADRLIARAHVHALLALRSDSPSNAATIRRNALAGSGLSATPTYEPLDNGHRRDGYEDSEIIPYGDGDPTHDRM